MHRFIGIVDAIASVFLALPKGISMAVPSRRLAHAPLILLFTVGLLVLLVGTLASTAKAAERCGQLWTLTPTGVVGPQRVALAVGIQGPNAVARRATGQNQSWCFKAVRQLWQYDVGYVNVYRIRAKATSLCLSTRELRKGAPVIQLKCAKGPEQEWIATPDAYGRGGRIGYRLTNAFANRCLDLPGGRTTDGTKLVAWDCDLIGAPGWNQIWYSQLLHK